MIIRGLIRAISPLHIGTVGVGNYHPTLRYIPARTLRGMLGNYLFNEDKELFEELRLSEDDGSEILFKSALPKGSLASPSILNWCKSCGRLFGEEQTECSDEKCLQEGKERGGFILKESYDERKFIAPVVKTRIDTKCPITRVGHTSPSERYKLAPYNIGVIEAGTEFDFRCVVKDEHVEEVKNALKDSGILYGIGGFRSKGYGFVEFEFEEDEKEEDYVRMRSSELEGSALLMVLNSEAIFEDSSGYVIGFKEEILKEDLGVVKIVKQKFSESKARGWMIERGRRWKTKQGYGLDRILPATGIGSSALVEMEAQKAAEAELKGIGRWKSIYGDVYFQRWNDVRGAK
jgi:CRISPR/Cas system CSM-associated protein Csm3 (group 7 of RAMP superfamily)